ncbi:hypothetical protein KP803_11410 [Vibrio sp. ZSDE26]|uniref:Uncharacterized protein n=1 Tax=Vibrio amylolyticus TaxID=2847292 RepID=A0A9X1XK23_9VIBR|nr:hypothetical protein [Vibrio amylolyticus]MCK6263876.1 hypothetical protein [Vibrio amylolyticus]
MSVSNIQSGYHIIEQSSRMTEDAAREIQQQSLPPPSFEAEIDPNETKISPSGINSAYSAADSELAFNKVKFDANEESVPPLIDPLIELSQAHQYNKIGTNMLQRDQDMIGTLLDIHI